MSEKKTGKKRKKRSKFRSKRQITNHTSYKNLRRKWVKNAHVNELDCFHTRQFSPTQFLRPLEFASRENMSISDACMYLRANEVECPSSETILKQCRDEGAALMGIPINQALSAQFNALPSKLRRHFRKHGVLLIDFHSDPYYGTFENPNILSGPRKQSTKRFYSYLTADLLTPRGKFTLAVIHRQREEALFDLFWELLS